MKTTLAAILLTAAPLIGGAIAQDTQPAAMAEPSLLAAEPAPLSDGDVSAYTQIFALQTTGDWKAADALIADLEDPVLLGYVLEQRYMHPTKYRSQYRELARWLQAYSDHPEARTIRKLAMKRRPAGETPRRAAPRRWRTNDKAPLPAELQADYDRAGITKKEEVRRIELRLRALTSKGRASSALAFLNEPRQFNALSRTQTDRARGWIAEAYYYEGNLTQAHKIATTASDRSPNSAVLSHWIAGLTTWRKADYDAAYTHFARMAAVADQDPKLRAMGAFWAARAAQRTGLADQVTPHLAIAASQPMTFYGQLALGQMGQASGVDWSAPVLTADDWQRLSAKSPRVIRAAALVQVGRTREAEDELRWAHGELTQAEDTALSALTHALALPTSQLLIAKSSGAEFTAPHLRAGLYPVPDYAPDGGFALDRALLFALIRQESKFMTHARSKVGAAGLMQLMPRTAAYVSGDRSLARSRTRASDALYEPGFNMALGQSYVQSLLTRYNDGRGDLFEMALSYNWGPGNFRRWRARNPIEDPLLMIESVPNREARGFVDHVITNLWLYRDRLGEPAPSRDALAAGKAPIYRSVTAAAD